MVDKLVTVKTEPTNEEDYSNHLNNNNKKGVESNVKIEENNCTPENKVSSDSDEQKPLIAKSEKERKDNDNNGGAVVQKTAKNSAAKTSRASASIAAMASGSTTAEKKDEDDESDDAVLDENQIYKKRRPILLSAINSHITCGLCNGYLIDATTIVECLHSFCHSCLIKHLRVEQYCPKCEMMINTAKPNIKPDTTLQAIVYKLVPGLYEKELMRKRAFYKDRPEEAASATPEQRGDDTEHLIFSPSDYMSLSLEYADLADLAGSSASYYKDLLKPRYLQCPAMYTVGHIKKFVYGKFEIDMDKFHIDIMYKVKTIVLLDHFTLMDVAYIYTWKRDAPMRFYFRVKRSTRPPPKIRKPAATTINQEAANVIETVTSSTEPKEATSKSVATDAKVLKPLEVVKEEVNKGCSKVAPKSEAASPSVNSALKTTSPSKNEQRSSKANIEPTQKLVQQNKNPTTQVAGPKLDANQNKTSLKSNNESPPEARRTENIKLKIDLSKNSSVTIINMSDPTKKEITKPLKPEKEFKVKRHSYINHSKSTSEQQTNAAGRPLTVPPLTIKTDRITSFVKPRDSEFTSYVKKSKSPPSISDEDKKSQFLKSFALAPISEVKSDSSPEKSPPPLLQSGKIAKGVLLPEGPGLVPPGTIKAAVASKRKLKEVTKTVPKKPRTSPPLPTSDFKILLPPSLNNNNTNNNKNNNNRSRTSPTDAKNKALNEKFLMPPPSTKLPMRPPSAVPKKTQKPPNKSTYSPAPLLSHGVPVAPPGNRTPIAKRYQPILPKATRPNPFANLPCSDINFSAQDTATDMKPPGKEASSLKVYGPNGMEPPRSSISQNIKSTASLNAPNNGAKKSETQNYLNFAILNSTKLKNNDMALGCRTPVYAPSSPIYSPNSPQYVPNYNISPIPTYKYTTPNPTGTNTSYLQSILGGNKDMASLFPTPPVRKESPLAGSNNITNKSNNNNNNNNNINNGNNNKQQIKQSNPLKRTYASLCNNGTNKSTEEPPEKSKVDALLNSCNINIPSSLSITITREDSETQSNNASYPKHKSPVNNYIEILKLPEQSTTDNVDKNTLGHQKTVLPMLQAPSVPQAKREIPDTKINGIPTQPKKLPKLDLPPSLNDKSNKKPNPASTLPKNIPATISLTPTHDKAAPILTQASSKSTSFNQQKPLSEKISHSPEKKSGLVSSTSADSSTTPHPRISPTTNGNAEYVKSPQTSPESSMLQAGKRLRHILPRQNTASIPEIIPPKVTTGNVIGTYASPSGVAVKIHASKKTTQKNNTITTTSPSSKSKIPSINDSAPNNLSCNSGSNNTNNNNYTNNKSKSSTGSASASINSKLITTTTTVTTTATATTSSGAPLNTTQSVPSVSVANTTKTTKTNSATTATSTTTSSIAATITTSTSTKKTPPPRLPISSSSSSSPSSTSMTTTQTHAAPKTTTTTTPLRSLLRVNSPNEHHNKISPPQPQRTQALPSSPLPTIPANKRTSPTLEDMPKSTGQTELSKFLKDNLLRAQMQVAAANQSKMFYTYANAAAAAQMSPFTPSIYNYQQAYIMEQLTRMQRAGADVFNDYMQKLKNGLEKTNMACEETQKSTKSSVLPLSTATPTTTKATTSSAQSSTAAASSTASSTAAGKRNANSPTIQKGQATSTAK